jgi:hypothetical protein
MPWSLQLTVQHLRDCVELSDEADPKPLQLRVEVTDAQLEALEQAIAVIWQQRQQTHDIAHARKKGRRL